MNVAETAADDQLRLVGNTPLVNVTALLDPAHQERGVQLGAKLEYTNPTGSIKDRIAVAMLGDAEQRGVLTAGQTILEPTSGNTGISLAWAARLLGYRMRAVIPDNATPERFQVLRLLGAEIVLSEGALGSNGAVRLAQELGAADPSLFLPMQYENAANPGAHYNGTAVELLDQFGRVDAFVAGLGTGGTLMGCAARLREANPDCQIIAAEPMPGDPVMGLRSLDDGYVPPILDATKLDRRLIVSNHDSVRGMRDLALAGVFAGVSSGAILHVGRRIAADLDDGARIAMIVPDSGWRYLSAGLWDRDLDELDSWMEHGHWW